MTNSQFESESQRCIIDGLMSVPEHKLHHQLDRLLKKFPKPDGSVYSKSEMLAFYKSRYSDQKGLLLRLFTKKPVRSLSGVTPVTVLTKPYPCPGECIFCPVDVRMPKSYIASEPGAARAAQNGFDPYLQVYNRLQAYKETGHPVSKLELIVLGGTWSAYPETYQIWFIKRLFDALNDFAQETDGRFRPPPVDLSASLSDGVTYNRYVSKATANLTDVVQVATWEELERAHQENETSPCRCVGLVLETRPDYVTENEVVRLRRLGATKMQLGVQSLNDTVLKLNHRGHTVSQTRTALALLRRAGFKLHCHWMPNLYGSNPASDKNDYQKLFTDPSLRPDELKVYPCSLIDKTALKALYDDGKWKPYTKQELSEVLTFVVTHTPEYCRLSRIIRDIPGQEILTGNKFTNFRQFVEQAIKPEYLHDIRAREIRGTSVDPSSLVLEDLVYETTDSTEHFMQYITKERRIAAFLRLALPKDGNYITELEQSAVIREVHVYGQSISVGSNASGNAQHRGIGKLLIKRATHIAHVAGYRDLAVISAIGTREYYRHLGFVDGKLYQHLAVTA